MKMKFVDLEKQYGVIEPLIEKRIKDVLQHGKFIMGPEITELEERLSCYVHCKCCVSCSSGTDALLMGLMGYGIGVGDAVFTTPFTFMATAEVICLLGATPIFVDIDGNTFNIDPHKLEIAIEDVKKGKIRAPGVDNKLRPRAIIAVDLFGLPAEYDQINQTAKYHNLVVLEDAAQSFGASYKGKVAGSLADIAATSFFPAKPLGCYGDGGAIFTDDEDMAERMRSLREHGRGPHKYDNIRIGINGRLDTLQAAVLLAKLEVFDDELKSRCEVAHYYTDRLGDGVKVPHTPDGLKSAWAQYSILVDNREHLMDCFKDAGVPTAVYYPKPLHLQKAFSHLGHQKGNFPIAEEVSERILSLPMHPYLRQDDQDEIIMVFKKYTGGI
jgi:UDP-2-acetamido-2-deoxy-ribo-hexuluronate aminotransferase